MKKETRIRIRKETFGTRPMKEAFEAAFAPYFAPKPVQQYAVVGEKKAAGQ